MNQEGNDILIPDSGEVYLLAGILLTTALFFSIIYFGLNKNRSYLFFTSYSLLGAISLLLLKSGYLLLFFITFTLSSLSLLYFFLIFFYPQHSKLIAVSPLGLVVLMIAGIGFFNEMSETIFLILAWFIFMLTLMACSWISLRAFNSQKYGGRLLFYTTALIFLFNIILIPDSFFISNMSVASGMFILAVTYTVLHDIKKQNELVKSLKFKAVHLENEMLKKSIQPHFLFNTLTILSEWIEEQPALAVEQIDRLSNEFRLLTRVSGKKLIPIEEELKICRIHLDIFNAKQGSHFTLETKNIQTGIQIPPMIFHTLIENGLTHSETDKGRFLIEQLERKAEKAELTTEYKTHFRVTAEPLSNQTESKSGEGLGLAYIKSRLEQAYPGKWNLTSERNNHAWETLIEISG